MASEKAKAAARARAKAIAEGKKVKPKLPLGERPKQLSSKAKELLNNPVRITGNAANPKPSASRAAALAGNNRAFEKGTSTSYSPKPMSAAAKAKAKAAGAKKQAATKNPMGLKALKNDKPARGAKAGSSTVSKVVKRAKTVAREARDVKTAVGTSLRDIEQNVRRAGMGVKPTGKNVGGNLKQQLKEVGTAIKSGKKGTSSDMYNKPGAYNKGTKRK